MEFEIQKDFPFAVVNGLQNFGAAGVVKLHTDFISTDFIAEFFHDGQSFFFGGHIQRHNDLIFYHFLFPPC